MPELFTFKCMGCCRRLQFTTVDNTQHNTTQAVGFVNMGGPLVCYDCFAVSERESLVNERWGILYYSRTGDRPEVVNYPRTLRFPVIGTASTRSGRFMVYFLGPDGAVWMGSPGQQPKMKVKRMKRQYMHTYPLTFEMCQRPYPYTQL